MRDFINGWTNGPDWKTWVAHSTIAVGISIPFGLAWNAEAAILVPAGYYFFREVEQVLYGIVGRNLDPDWVDHVLDVVAPTAAVLVAWSWAL